MLEEALWSEMQVLGGMLLDSKHIPQVYDILSTDDFTEHAHRELYGLITKTYSDNGKFDVSMIQRTAEHDKLIMKCAENTVSASATLDEARLVKKYSNALKAINIMAEYQADKVTPANVDSIVKDALDRLSDLANTNKKTKLARVGEGMLAAYYGRIFEADRDKYRVMTGFTQLDNILGGVWKSDMSVIAARPGVGKSAFAVNVIYNLIKAGKNTALYSFEMGKSQVLERILPLMSNVPLWRIRQGSIQEEQNAPLAVSAGVLNDLPLYICDDATTIQQMKIECRIRNIDVLIVDYLSLTPSETRHTSTYERVSELARGYKQLAMQLNIPVIVLAQLNRQTEGRASNKPSLSDLRDSGEIEQAANQIIFLFEHNGDLAVNVAKNRQGETGTVIMEFDKPVMRMRETERVYREPEKRRGECGTTE